MPEQPKKPGRRTCEWASQARALNAFAEFAGKTESAEQIKPLHWYVACRLVIEGGFHPDDITPRPPFRVVSGKAGHRLEYAPELGGGGERTVLGGLKTKNVDVVVTREGIGPVLAVSCKGVTGALRNLTNRMEEMIGECTNLHITYPALALGYLVVVRANRRTEEVLAATPAEGEEPGRQLTANDMVLNEGGDPVAGIIRFHNALRQLLGRHGIRNDVSRYEAVAIALVDMLTKSRGQLLPTYPPADSPLRLEPFFDTLYLRYDERFVYSAPELKKVTERLEWTADSPAISGDGIQDIDYPLRVAE